MTHVNHAAEAVEITPWGRRRRDFRRDEGGAVAMMFGLSLLPLLLAVGLGIDYGRARGAQARLNAAADGAALAAVARTALAGTPEQGAAAARAAFEEAASRLPGVQVSDLTVESTGSVGSRAATVSYTADIDASFAQLIGRQRLPFGGRASTETATPRYIDFHLLLDNSPSMGIAAGPGDIARMEGLTGCAFACHKHTFDAQGRITGDQDGRQGRPKDAYTVARENNVTLRIDVLRTATQALLDKAVTSRDFPNQYRFSVHQFSDQLVRVADLSANLPSVRAATDAVDLAYSLYGDPDAQTSYDVALPAINRVMPDPGNGDAAGQPLRFLFLITDGVQDETVANLPSPRPSGNVNGNRRISTLDPTLCTAIKDRGIKVAVLHTPYMPLPSNGFYNQWIGPIAAQVPRRLEDCASPGFFKTITPAQGVDAALLQLFESAVKTARLTR